MTPDLLPRLKKAIEPDEKHALKESYAHCQSPGVAEQIKYLSDADKVTWYAGHHCGFHKGVSVAEDRLRPILEELLNCVRELELRNDNSPSGSTTAALARLDKVVPK